MSEKDVAMVYINDEKEMRIDIALTDFFKMFQGYSVRIWVEKTGENK